MVIRLNIQQYIYICNFFKNLSKLTLDLHLDIERKQPLLCLNFKLKRLGPPNILEIIWNRMQFCNTKVKQHVIDDTHMYIQVVNYILFNRVLILKKNQRTTNY